MPRVRVRHRQCWLTGDAPDLQHDSWPRFGAAKLDGWKGQLHGSLQVCCSIFADHHRVCWSAAVSRRQRVARDSDGQRARTDWQKRDENTWVKVVPPWWAEHKTVHFASECTGWRALPCRLQRL